MRHRQKTYDIVYDVVRQNGKKRVKTYDIVRFLAISYVVRTISSKKTYDVVYDIVYDIVYDDMARTCILTYDIVLLTYDIVYDIAYDIVYDIVHVYDIVYDIGIRYRIRYRTRWSSAADQSPSESLPIFCFVTKSPSESPSERVISICRIRYRMPYRIRYRIRCRIRYRMRCHIRYSVLPTCFDCCVAGHFVPGCTVSFSNGAVGRLRSID